MITFEQYCDHNRNRKPFWVVDGDKVEEVGHFMEAQQIADSVEAMVQLKNNENHIQTQRLDVVGILERLKEKDVLNAGEKIALDYAISAYEEIMRRLNNDI